MNVEHILDIIKSKCSQFNCTKVDLENNILINNDQINNIINLISYFYLRDDEQCKKFANDLFYDIFKNPKRENGKVYEALAYSWLLEKKIRFRPQVKIDKDECLKKNNYDADGEILGADNDCLSIIFDVKFFGIGFPHISTLKKKLEEKLPDYIITISGSADLSNEDLNKYALTKIDEIAQELQSEERRIFDSYIYKISELYLEIRATPRKSKIVSSMQEFNPYYWAENNKFYFINHGSQFCIKSPYIILCPFDNNAGIFQNDDAGIIQMQLRPLCRRIFMELKTMTDRRLCEFDGKAKENITISTASRKISAIVFLDVTKKYEYSNERTWVFINPNADNPIPNYKIDSLFRNNGAYIDYFDHDNY